MTGQHPQVSSTIHLCLGRSTCLEDVALAYPTLAGRNLSLYREAIMVQLVTE
jgi:hypothetical protein